MTSFPFKKGDAVLATNAGRCVAAGFVEEVGWHTDLCRNIAWVRHPGTRLPLMPYDFYELELAP